MRIFVCCFLLLAVGMAAAAADVTGRWSGTFTSAGADGQSHESGALLIFKQNGSEVTGTAGPDENQQWEITSGKVDGNKITAEARSPNGGLAKFELVLADEHLKGEVAISFPDRQGLQGKLDVARAK